MLKKGYTGFILWMIGYTVLLFLVPLLPIEDGGLMTRIVLALTSLAIAGLMLLIYVTEKVFWFNGVTYEEAAEAGSERRKLYALRHLIVFSAFTAAYLLFTVIGVILHWPFWIDIIVFCIGMILTAISTIRIRL